MYLVFNFPGAVLCPIFSLIIFNVFCIQNIFIDFRYILDTCYIYVLFFVLLTFSSLLQNLIFEKPGSIGKINRKKMALAAEAGLIRTKVCDSESEHPEKK